MKLKHRETLDTLQQQLNEAKSKISTQNHHIQKLQDLVSTAPPPQPKTTQSKGNSGMIWTRPSSGRREPSKAAGPPAASLTRARYLGDTIAFKNKRCSTVPHERHRQRVMSPRHRKAATVAAGQGDNDNNMENIFEMLEKEGYRPSEAKKARRCDCVSLESNRGGQAADVSRKFKNTRSANFRVIATPTQNARVYRTRSASGAAAAAVDSSSLLFIPAQREKEEMQRTLKVTDEKLTVSQLTSRSTQDVLKQ